MFCFSLLKLKAIHWLFLQLSHEGAEGGREQLISVLLGLLSQVFCFPSQERPLMRVITGKSPDQSESKKEQVKESFKSMATHSNCINLKLYQPGDSWCDFRGKNKHYQWWTWIVMLQWEVFLWCFFQKLDSPKCNKEVFLSTKIVESIGTALPLVLGKGEAVWVPQTEHEV